MKQKSLRKKAAAALAALILIMGGLLLLLPGEEALAEQVPEGGSVVLQNEDGDEVVVKVEESLTAEERALRNESSIAGAMDLADSDVPLAGFSALDPEGFGVDQIHVGWMALLLAAALGYAAYFTRFQSRLFDLRRDVAAAEHELFGKGRK